MALSSSVWYNIILKTVICRNIMKGKRKTLLAKRTGGWWEPVQGFVRSALEWVVKNNNGDSVTIT